MNIDWISQPLYVKVLAALGMILVIIALSRVFRKVAGRAVANVDNRYRVRKLISFISYFVIALLIAVVFADRITGLTVAIGVAGAGIAFALQEVIGSIAGWFAIMFAGFYSTGDRVEVGGIKGDVIDVSFLRTTLMEVGEWVQGDLYNGRVVRVANSFVFKAPVFNYSGDFPFLWDEIKIPVRYGSDHQMARQILVDVLEELTGGYAKSAQTSWDGMVNKYRIENAVVTPQVTLALNDNWIEFTLRYAVNFKRRRETMDSIYSNVLERFENSNGKVKLASATIEIVDAPSINVSVDHGDAQ